METGTEGIRLQSRTYTRVENLMRKVNRESLIAMHLKQPAEKAKGVDGIGKAEYGENLEGNISNLLDRMKRFSYRPLPVRRTYIPKANGKMRPLAYLHTRIDSCRVSWQIFSMLYTKRGFSTVHMDSGQEGTPTMW